MSRSLGLSSLGLGVEPKSSPFLGLVSSSVRLTKQLCVVLQVLSSSDDHPTVDRIYERAVLITKGISRATVYRNVKKLNALGIIEKHDFGFGRYHYEIATSHHHHLIDTVSKRVINFASHDLELLKENIAKDLGFKLVAHRLEMYGVPLNNSDGDNGDK